ncbi:MAG: DUF169 domain-containing protein [Dehalococcoidia bacterium]
MASDWATLNTRLQDALGLSVAPIAITFAPDVPAGVATLDRPMPEPSGDGRTGRAAAGCVFWMSATDSTFATVAEDHANCSVGSMTHGFKTLDEVGNNEDVAALLGSGWVTMEDVPQIPVVQEQPGSVVYGPLSSTPVDPDVVLLRVTGRQLMVLHDAYPGLRIEGKPQCHIIAVAKEQGEMAASVGCQLSRVRTGMPNGEMTCAIPASMVPEVIDRVERTGAADSAVARYASTDMQRFA